MEIHRSHRSPNVSPDRIQEASSISQSLKLSNLSADQSFDFLNERSVGKIITDEDDELIKVGVNTYKEYFFGYYGGWRFILIVNTAMMVFLAFKLCADYITGKWADDPDQSGDKFAFYSLLSFAFAAG